MQRLRGVLQQALLDGFQSKLKDSKNAGFAEEVVNAILLELETWLVDLGSETIDQVAGRLETRLRELEKNLGEAEGSTSV